jgi:glycosyltransferase involved in cell wall biosynthesis
VICAVIPAYNASPTVGAVTREAAKYLSPVIVVDDGSRDATAETARGAGATVVSLGTNSGKGAALARGFDEALAIGAEAVIALDADGQHAPSDIPTFLAAYRARGTDLVIGQRSYAQMPWTRRLANSTGRTLLRLATRWDMPDNQSGYRLYSERALRSVRPERSDFAAEVEMIVQARNRGLSVEWVPIQTIYADEGSHFRPIHDTALFLRLVWRLWRARRAGERRDGGAI